MGCLWVPRLAHGTVGWIPGSGEPRVHSGWEIITPHPGVHVSSLLGLRDVTLQSFDALGVWDACVLVAFHGCIKIHFTVACVDFAKQITNRLAGGI